MLDCITIQMLFHVTPKDFDSPQVRPLPVLMLFIVGAALVPSQRKRELHAARQSANAR